MESRNLGSAQNSKLVMQHDGFDSIIMAYVGFYSIFIQEQKIIGFQKMKVTGKKQIIVARRETGLWSVFIVDGRTPSYRPF